MIITPFDNHNKKIKTKASKKSKFDRSLPSLMVLKTILSNPSGEEMYTEKDRTQLEDYFERERVRFPELPDFLIQQRKEYAKQKRLEKSGKSQFLEKKKKDKEIFLDKVQEDIFFWEPSFPKTLKRNINSLKKKNQRNKKLYKVNNSRMFEVMETNKSFKS